MDSRLQAAYDNSQLDDAEEYQDDVGDLDNQNQFDQLLEQHNGASRSSEVIPNRSGLLKREKTTPAINPNRMSESKLAMASTNNASLSASVIETTNDNNQLTNVHTNGFTAKSKAESKFFDGSRFNKFKDSVKEIGGKSGQAPKPTARELSFLPKTFDVKAMENNRPSTTDFCQICEDKFRALINPVQFCDRCAKAICKACSSNQRVLSQNDPNAYKVCDMCDTQIENAEISANQEEMIESQKQIILALDAQTEQMDQELQQQKAKQRQEVKALELEHQNFVNALQEDEYVIEDIQAMLEDLNAQKQHLFSQVFCQSLIKKSLESEKRREQQTMVAKKDQMFQIEMELDSKKAENQRLLEELEALKQQPGMENYS